MTKGSCFEGKQSTSIQHFSSLVDQLKCFAVKATFTHKLLFLLHIGCVYCSRIENFFYTHQWTHLGFGIMPKDIFIYRDEEQGIELSTFPMENSCSSSWSIATPNSRWTFFEVLNGNFRRFQGKYDTKNEITASEQKIPCIKTENKGTMLTWWTTTSWEPEKMRLLENELQSFSLATDDRGHSKKRTVHNTWQLSIWHISAGRAESYSSPFFPALLQLVFAFFNSRKFPCLPLFKSLSPHL